MWTDNTAFQPAHQPDVLAELSIIVRAVSQWVVIADFLLVHICTLRNIKRRKEGSIIIFLLPTGGAPQWLLSHVTCVATRGNMICSSNKCHVLPFRIFINWNGIVWYIKCSVPLYCGYSKPWTYRGHNLPRITNETFFCGSVWEVDHTFKWSL